MRRYLFGPIPALYAQQNLAEARRRKDCLTFGPEGNDLAVRLEDTWESILARLPPAWRPDFLVLYLSYAVIPEALVSAPVPTVGLAADWTLHWHLYRHRLPRCDAVLTDARGVEALARDGLGHAVRATLFGCESGLLERLDAAEAPRDIDILYVGNFNPAVQRGRMPYLGRVARLAARWNVVIRTAVQRDDYHGLLARSRVVFNRSIRGEANLRTFEAAAAGALLFQEAGNREAPDYFRHGRECVFYDDSDLESLLEYYLAHEDERQAIADAARYRVEGCRFDALWREALGRLARGWPDVEARSRSRPAAGRTSALIARAWQAAHAASGSGLDPYLEGDLARALEATPDSSALWHATGVVLATSHLRQQPGNVTLLARAADHFRRAADGPLGFPVALLNYAEVLAGLGQTAEAVRQCERLLALLEQPEELDPLWPDTMHVPPVWDYFRVEWEAAAWQNAGEPALEGQAKLQLLRWRGHALLAELTGRLAHFEGAVLARPDLPSTQAALGCALGRAGRAADAIPHLRAAVVANPLDNAAARALAQALADTKDTQAALDHALWREQLHRAVPQAVAEEPWFRGVGRRQAPRVSACLIVRDEEANLADCLAGLAGLVHDVVVVDTGSTDRTREVATTLGVRLVDFPWGDDFAAARNESIRHAAGDWVFWLDADERLGPRNQTRLRVLLAGLVDDNSAYVMTCVNDAPPGGESTVIEQVRLFRNRPDVRWENRVYEQILPAVRRSGAEVRRTSVALRHLGPAGSQERAAKQRRNQKLLERERLDRPDDPRVLFHLGVIAMETGSADEAVGLFERCLGTCQADDPLLRSLHARMANLRLSQGDPGEALRWCLRGLALFPDDAELLLLEAAIRTELNDLVGAEASLVRLLGMPADGHLASTLHGVRTYRAFNQLAVVCRRRGALDEAERLWRRALADHPAWLPAWRGLGELLLQRGRRTQWQEAVHAIEKLPQGEAEARRQRQEAARRWPDEARGTA